MNQAVQDSPARDRARNPRTFLVPLLVAAGFFVAIAPTLPWPEFAGGSENLVVETVLEMRRGGPWFIPTLQGEPRHKKPPWTAWLAAAAARAETVGRLTSRDRAARDAAFRELAFQVRWPTLLSACLMLVAVYALGELLFGRPGGFVSALACGSTLMFLRFCRSATTDVQLALWVTAANAFLALALLERRRWVGFLGAGAALGLSLMSKGPVGLVQSVLPFALFLLWRRFAMPAPSARPARGTGVTIVAGILVMLAIALPWPVAVLLRYPEILPEWWREITREGATQLAPDPWYTYFVFPLWIVPWLSFLVAGLWVGGASLVRTVDDSPDGGRWREGFVLALMLVVVPLLVMSFAKDKNERYALPMTAPAAVLAAGAAVAWWKSDRRDPAGRVVEGAHWLTLAVLAVGMPVLGLWAPRFGLGDQPWFPAGVGVAIGAAALCVVALGWLLTRRLGVAAAAGTAAALVLLLQYPLMRGYSRVARSDLKPLADAVWAQYPDAALYEYEPGTRTRTYLDLPIYAGRLTSKVNDPSALRPGRRPQIVVFFHRKGEPPALGEPWRELMTGGGRKDHWRAFVLPAAAP